MRPILKIGITDCKKYQHYKQWFLHAPEGVEVIHLSDQLNNLDAIKRCDGIVLSGGEDVHPSRYQQPGLLQHLDEAAINPNRDAFEWQVIEEGFKMNKPFLGICRGLQLMNVYLGGTLIYDIPTIKNVVGHGSINNIDGRHAIDVNKGSLLFSIANNTLGEVNSAHHQSVDRCAEQLEVTATSDTDIVESMQWKNAAGKPWLLLVQWHPERMTDQENPFASGIRTAFLHHITESK